jgi:hypothetical protein
MFNLRINVLKSKNIATDTYMEVGGRVTQEAKTESTEDTERKKHRE